MFVLILLYWLYAFFSSHSTVLLCVGHMHTSPALFSGKFIPPFSMLLIGLIALLVKCWDLLLQRFETAPCNVYLPDMAEIICFHNTWTTSAFQQLAGLVRSGFGLAEWTGSLSKWGSQGEEHQRPRRRWVSNTCWNNHMYLFMAYLDIQAWLHTHPRTPTRVGQTQPAINISQIVVKVFFSCDLPCLWDALGKSRRAMPGPLMGAEPAPVSFHAVQTPCRGVQWGACWRALAGEKTPELRLTRSDGFGPWLWEFWICDLYVK